VDQWNSGISLAIYCDIPLLTALLSQIRSNGRIPKTTKKACKQTANFASLFAEFKVRAICRPDNHSSNSLSVPPRDPRIYPSALSLARNLLGLHSTTRPPSP
jgi:hypothetical protein